MSVISWYCTACRVSLEFYGSNYYKYGFEGRLNTLPPFICVVFWRPGLKGVAWFTPVLEYL